VPTVLTRELGIDRPDDHTWDAMPPRRAVAAAGLRVLRTVKCTVGNIDRCPYGQNWWGKYHPRPAPWGGLAVDDVVAKFPAGEIVRLRFWGVTMPGNPRRDAIFLVSPADFARYEEMTGWSGSVSFEPGAEDLPPRAPSGAAECRNVQPKAPQHPGIWGIDPASPMWCDSCGGLHPVVEHRDCRAGTG